jgi:uncharacterized metal-binding protein
MVSWVTLATLVAHACSGLDSVTALTIVTRLKRLAEAKECTVCVGQGSCDDLRLQAHQGNRR